MKLATMDDEQIYHYALGRFVSLFSKAEHMVFFYLADILGITQNECNAITSGAKIDGCISYIKRVHEARGIAVPANILDCLDRLGPLNKLRNDLLHLYTDSDFTVTNEARTLPGRVISYKIAPEILEDADRDLVKATLILSNAVTPFAERSKELERAQAAMNEPWLYKPPSQANSYPNSPTKPQEQPPPPTPSGEKS
jgi:hypothetical protein